VTNPLSVVSQEPFPVFSQPLTLRASGPLMSCGYTTRKTGQIALTAACPVAFNAASHLQSYRILRSAYPAGHIERRNSLKTSSPAQHQILPTAARQAGGSQPQANLQRSAPYDLRIDQSLGRRLTLLTGPATKPGLRRTASTAAVRLSPAGTTTDSGGLIRPGPGNKRTSQRSNRPAR
jgi:hypothetical protein